MDKTLMLDSKGRLDNRIWGKPFAIGFVVGIVTFVVLALLVVALSGSAHAGTGGTGMFDTIYTDLSDWTTGYLGRVFSIMALLVGLGGAIKGNYTALFGGLGVATGAMYGPSILESVITALLP